MLSWARLPRPSTRSLAPRSQLTKGHNKNCFCVSSPHNTLELTLQSERIRVSALLLLTCVTAVCLVHVADATVRFLFMSMFIFMFVFMLMFMFVFLLVFIFIHVVPYAKHPLEISPVCFLPQFSLITSFNSHYSAFRAAPPSLFVLPRKAWRRSTIDRAQWPAEAVRWFVANDEDSIAANLGSVTSAHTVDVAVESEWNALMNTEGCCRGSIVCSDV